MTTAAAMTTINPFNHVNPMANGANADQGSGTAATISANDFLTLLVTEMKNQDPTAQTDPNAYVNQLVQVNSLEQLIEINENLSSSLGTTGDAAGARTGIAAQSPGTMGNASDSSVAGKSNPNPVSAFAGNLGVSHSTPAAQRMAQALSGRN